MKSFRDYSIDELCGIENNIATFRWDDRLGEKPEGFDDLPFWNHRWIDKIRKRKTKYEILKPIHLALRGYLGDKQILKYHHMHDLNRTEEEFEKWWASHKDDPDVHRY